MDNIQLMYELDKINATTNEFDRIEQLRAFNPVYKKSDFYKRTRMSLKQVLQWLIQVRLEKAITKLTNTFNGDSLVEIIENAINNIDSGTIENLFDKFVDVFDPTQLQEQRQELKDLVNKVQP